MSAHAVAVERVPINQVGDCLEANAGELTSISINYLNNIWWNAGRFAETDLDRKACVRVQ